MTLQEEILETELMHAYEEAGHNPEAYSFVDWLQNQATSAMTCTYRDPARKLMQLWGTPVITGVIQYGIVTGNPVLGFRYFGPFQTDAQAVDYGSRLGGTEWWPITIQPVE